MSKEVSLTHTWYERLFNLISVVKQGEGISCALLSANICLLMTVFYLLKVIREPLILAYGGAEYKSYATAYQAAILMLIVPLLSVLYHHFSESEHRSSFINRILLFFASNLVVFASLDYLNFSIGFAFYVWLGLFGLMVIAQFWAFAADSYNIRSGQRLFVILAVGATLGSWLGSKIAGPLFPAIGVVGIMLLASILILLCVYLISKVNQCIPETSANNETVSKEGGINPWLEGFSVVFNNRYLLLIAGFVIVLVFINSSGEYILARFVSEHSQSMHEADPTFNIEVWQNQFYSSYYSWVTLGSFVLQLLVVSRIFKLIGIKGAILLLPIVILLSYGLILFFPVFSLIRLIMTAENSIHYSVQNTTHHALFLPVPRKLKYLGKTTIDTFFYRIGDLFYGVFVFISIQHFDLSIHGFILTNLLLALLLLGLAWKVGRQNILEVQQVLGNSPPQVKAQIPRLLMRSGILSEFSISESTFIDPDIGDALRYYVKQDSGKPLPDWIMFDRMSRTFTFEPPINYKGSINIEVTASDYEGMTATARVEVTFFIPPENEIGI